jgi:hypothetical protein
MSDWDVVEQKAVDDWEVEASMPISTITGKPEPTDAERLLQSGRAVSTMYPIVGDIVMTAAMPQLALPAKAGLLARMGIRGVNALMRGAGAGAGSVYGELERQLATGEHSKEGLYIQGALGGAGEPVMSLIGAGGKVAAQKFGKPALELASDLTVTGGKVKQIMTERLRDALNKRAEAFVTQVAPAGVKKNIGEVGFDKALAEAYDEKTLLYNHFKDTLEEVATKNKGYVPLENTRQYMQAEYTKYADPVMVAAGKIDSKAESAVLKEMGLKGSDDLHITMRRLMRGNDLTPAEINHFQANIFPRDTRKWVEMHPGKQGAKTKIKDLVMQDLDALGIASGKTSADAVHKELKQFEQLRKLYESNGATWMNPETGERIFKPARFLENVKKAERNIRKYQPEIWEKLQPEIQYYEWAADALGRGKRNLGGATMLLGSGGAAYLSGGIPIASELFGAASAWALMSPSSQKTITGLLKPIVNKPVAKTLLHIGGQEIDFAKGH